MKLKLILLTGAVILSSNVFAATYNGTNIDNNRYNCSGSAKYLGITLNATGTCTFKGNRITVDGVVDLSAFGMGNYPFNQSAELPTTSLTDDNFSLPASISVKKQNIQAQVQLHVDFEHPQQPSNFNIAG